MPLHLDRTQLALLEHGRAGADRTVVLLHGMGDSAACWPDATARWAERHQVIAVDARGHGRSPRFTAEQLMDGPGEVMVADTVTLLDDLARAGVQRPCLVGHSMGASVAALAAAEAPDLVRALVLEDPAWRDDLERRTTVQRATERVAGAERARLDVAAEVERGRQEHPSWPDAELWPWAVSTTETDHGFLALENPLPKAPWRHVARSLRVPTLLVTGTVDVIVGVEVRLALGEVANPMIEVAVVEGAGHCVRRDRPDGYHAVVDPWLSALFETGIAAARASSTAGSTAD